MSKKFKIHASSSRAVAGGFGAFSSSPGSFSTASVTDSHTLSSLSYVAEPPDLSKISHAQSIVAFKNVLKKDETTKAKALEDLKSYLIGIETRDEPIEDGFLEAWINIYPRTSIDNSRRVRQLAHVTQGLLASLAGKRIARHLPKVIGAWLAGLYDHDRLVSRAAVESFTRVFATDEKRNQLWKVYQRSILEFVEDVILHQTVLSLSDERIVKPDEAEAKYARVSGTALHLLNRIINSASDHNLGKDLSIILTLITANQLWSLSHHEDPFVRRSLFNLLSSCLLKNLEGIDWKQISVSIIGSALASSQFGSAVELSEGLLQLSRTRPAIWTDDYPEKSIARKRLYQFLEKGSQGGNMTYWHNVAGIVQALPKDVITTDGSPETVYRNTLTLAESVRKGVISRDEPRQNIKAGWNCYIQICLWSSTLLPDDDRSKFVEDTLICLLDHYVMEMTGGSQWDLPSQDALDICANCFVRLSEHGYQGVLMASWKRVFKKLDQAIRLSSPEQSKNFKVSQDAICDQAKRVFSLEAAVLERVTGSPHGTQIMVLFEEVNRPFLLGCLQTLQARNGKPYGAASMVEEAARYIPLIVTTSSEVVDLLKKEVVALFDSPSAERAISIVVICKDWNGFEPMFQECITRLTKGQIESSHNSTLNNLFSAINFGNYESLNCFNKLTTKLLEKALSGDRAQWDLINSLLGNQTLPVEILEIVFALTNSTLSSSDGARESLFGLEYIVGRSPASIRRLAEGEHASQLVSKLLVLSDCPDDEIALNAERLEKKIRDLLPAGLSNEISLQLLQKSFINVNGESLSIDSWVTIAANLYQNTKPEALTLIANKLIPNQQTWKNALQPFLDLPPRPSTAITSPLGNTVQLVEYQFSADFWNRLRSVSRDSEGFSAAYRLVSFTTNFLSTIEIVKFLSVEQRDSLLYYFPLALQLVDDDISIAGSNGITSIESDPDWEEISNTAQLGRKLIDKWIRLGTLSGPNNEDSICSSLASLWTNKLNDLENASPESYRIAETFTKIMVEVRSQKPMRKSGSFDGISKEVRTMNFLRAAATLTVWRESIVSNPSGVRLCNEMIAFCTGLRPETQSGDALKNLIFLNLLLQGDDGVLSSIPTQRLVFLLKNLIDCARVDDMALSIKPELFKAMAILLKQMRDIFGSHWNDSIMTLVSTWKSVNGNDESLPIIHSSLRLYACLNKLALGENNEDLEEAWSESQGQLAEGLVSILQKINASSLFYQPRDMTLDLLSRQISTVKVDAISNTNELYPLLAAQSERIQRAVYDIFHRLLPITQERVSFEVAISKIVVNLPDELLSLLLEPPEINTVSRKNKQNGWAGLRAYLLSWKLVFDHFSGSSLPVQENYAANIRDHSILNPLLDFAFGFLERSNGKLVDASKIDIRSFEPGLADSPEEMDSLLVHLYFLAAKFLPTLTKNWWIDSENRVKGPVETWTQKYISPSITEESLNNVSEWIKKQEQEDERPLVVKVSQRASELVASIIVDEESPPVAMAITLPPGYPLQPAVVTSRSRVLVDEKKWRSWLLTVQGVIMFSNGNLVDGLLAFRNNVQGALKGHGECAICYSVISTDMQTPNKKCATCKNTFHSVCLFRWFKSSNQSTCPLCRNNFIYV